MLMLLLEQCSCGSPSLVEVKVFLHGERSGRRVWVAAGTSWSSFIERCRGRLALRTQGSVIIYDEDSAELRSVEEIEPGETLTIKTTAPPLQGELPNPAWWPTLRRVGHGWSPQEGLKAWDPWLVQLPHGTWRLYFLAAWWPRGSEEFWFNSNMATASGYDLAGPWQTPQQVTFRNWDYSSTGVRLLAGDAVLHDNKIWLFFSTGSTTDRVEDPIRIGTSPLHDGVEFTMLQGLSIGRPSQWQNTAWRDPFVVASNPWRMYISGRQPASPSATSFQLCNPACMKTQYRGAIAVYEGGSLEGPWLTPLSGASATDTAVVCNHTHKIHGTVTDSKGTRPAVKAFKVQGLHEGFWEMERPQVLAGPGGTLHHLFFNCWARYINPDWASRHLKGLKPSDSALYHFVAETATGPFRPSVKTPIVPGSIDTGIYGTRLVQQTDDYLVLGWVLGEFSLEVSGRLRMRWGTDGEPYIHHLST